MARPKKQTVDYFPHSCNGGKSLFIVQNQHGNDGYAFWFKLLQLLGKSEGHFLDYNNRDNWLFLLTETHVPGEKAEQILETLASIGSIDKGLWEKKIIWSQHFVDNVADVYTRRQAGVPVRPGDSLPESTVQLAKVSSEKEPVIAQAKELGAKIAGMVTLYEEELGRVIANPTDYERLKDFAVNYPEDWFKKAVAEAKKNEAQAPMRYIETILERWIKEGGPSEKRGTKANKGQSTHTTAEKLEESTKRALR